MKDEQYNKYDQDRLNAAENQYFANIEHDKDSTWERIEERLKKKTVIPIWIYFAAASILLILGISFIFNQSLNHKNNEIAELKLKYEIQKSSNNNPKSIKYQHINSDTVKIVQEKIVQIPVSSRDTLIIYDTISKIMVQKDTIFIREKNTGSKNEKKVLVSNKTFENQNIVNVNIKKKKERRFIFHFGKPKNESSNNEEPGLFTLRTK